MMETVKLDEWFRPEGDITYRVEGGPAIKLCHRSHKRPMAGGPTKETTVLAVEFQGESADLTLESRGISGKPQTELHPVPWKRWTFTSREDAMIVIREANAS